MIGVHGGSMRWPTAQHILVTVRDVAMRRVVRYRCKCGEWFEESFPIRDTVESAKESYAVLMEMHKAAINGEVWQGEQARTSKQVRESDANKWLTEHQKCGAATPPTSSDGSPPLGK